jgi:hypothetical protein
VAPYVKFTSNGTVTVAPFAGVFTVITPAANTDTGTQKVVPKINSPKISCRLQTFRTPVIDPLARAVARQQPLWTKLLFKADGPSKTRELARNMVCKGAKAELLNDEQKFIFGASDCQFLPRLAHLLEFVKSKADRMGRITIQSSSLG